MTALAKPRGTLERQGGWNVDPVAANVKIWQGSLVVLDADGNAKPGVTATGLKARGRADGSIDNTGGAAGDVVISTKRGVFCWANSADDPVNRTHIGQTVYIQDDQTVAATNGTNTRSAAGICRDLTSEGVWVEI